LGSLDCDLDLDLGTVIDCLDCDLDLDLGTVIDCLDCDLDLDLGTVIDCLDCDLDCDLDLDLGTIWCSDLFFSVRECAFTFSLFCFDFLLFRSCFLLGQLDCTVTFPTCVVLQEGHEITFFFCDLQY